MSATLYKNKRSGAALVDKGMLDVVPFQFLTDVPNNAPAVGALSEVGPYVMTVSREGPVVLKQLSMQSTAYDSPLSNALIRMKFQDGSGPGVMLMNAPVLMNTIFGNGQKPYHLPKGLFLEENHSIEVYYYNLSVSSNTIRINGGCKRLRKPVPDPSGALQRQRMQRRQYVELPYFLTFDTSFVTLTGSSTGTGTFSIPNDFAFEVHQLSFASTGIFNVDIYNQSTGESLILAPNGAHYQVPNTLLLGDGEFPVRLHEPWMIGPGQKLVCDMTDTSTSTNTVYITLGGVLYRTGVQR